MKAHHFYLILVALLFMAAGETTAQKNKRSFKKADLEGVWQMCFYVSELPDIPGELRPGNTFKVLSEDGYITNFTIIPNKGAIITGYGTYEQVSDTVYNENIKRSIHLPMLNEQVNALQFEICDTNLLRLKFYIEHDEHGHRVDTWYHETWKRVEMPNEYPTALVR